MCVNIFKGAKICDGVFFFFVFDVLLRVGFFRFQDKEFFFWVVEGVIGISDDLVIGLGRMGGGVMFCFNDSWGQVVWLFILFYGQVFFCFGVVSFNIQRFFVGGENF